MRKAAYAIILGLVMTLHGSLAHAAVPLAEIEGDITPQLRDMLISVIGQAEAPPRSLAQARRRGEKAEEQARKVMRSQGYYGADIQSQIIEFSSESPEENWRPPTPILKIQPGKQFSYSQIAIEYLDAAPDIKPGVDKTVALVIGKPAIAAEVVAAELRGVNFLKANGYPETKILPRKVIVDHATKTMQVSFNFEVGDKTRFGEITQTGSANLSKNWPKIVAPFNSGEVFSDKLLNKLSSRVIATGVFDSATAVLDDTKTPNNDGTVTRNIILNVEQGDINTLTGEIGYSTTDGSGIDLSYERRNFIGYAQTLTLSSTLKTNQIQLGIDYNIPYFLRDDRTLDLNTEIAQEETDAFTGERVSGNALITQKISNKLKMGAGLGLEASRYEEDEEDVTAYLLELLGHATYDTRDTILDPSKGIRIEASARPTYNFGEEDGLFTTVDAIASTYHRVSDTLVAAGRVKVGTILGTDLSSVPLNRRFYGGGGGSVRGFGYQSISPEDADGDLIGGRSITEVSAEFRYHGDSAFGGALFLDAGSVAQNEAPTLHNTRYGAGIGLRYYTSFAPLRADIAIPLNKREGDDDFHIYISIGQAF